MTLPVILALIWLILANVKAMLPSRDKHWRFAYVMIAVGIPLLGWVTYDAGPLVGLAFMAAGASVLRWPIVFLLQMARAALSCGMPDATERLVALVETLGGRT